MTNKCDIIDFSKHSYKDKGWLELEKIQEECRGKVKKWRCATCEDFAEKKNGILYYGGSPIIKNDKGIWGSDFKTKDDKHGLTFTFVDGMKKNFKTFKVIKRSDGRLTNKLK